MSYELPTAGSASDELAAKALAWWMEAAEKSGKIDLSGFDPTATLADRIAWAEQARLDIAAILSRYSTKMQDSTESQVKHCIDYAARHGIYVPPELICVDEAQKGRRVRRDGLDRVKGILKNRYAKVLLVFKVSRILRAGYLGFQFIQEQVVEEGLRAVSVSQGIDTDDTKTWKGLMYLHGMMDDMLLDTIADHCRAGLRTLFEEGYTTGALPVGYRRVEVPGPPTKRGLPRTAPGVDPDVAKLIRQHIDWIRNGMSIREGWRRWLDADGPCDPRSTLGYMSRKSYRRMLSNGRLLGVWAFGRKRSRWSSKRDYNRQVEQPETEVAIYRCEELRIVDDEPFLALQERLEEFKLGPRGPRKRKPIHLWDLTTELFFCASCNERFYQTGAHGKGMQCKRGELCPCKSAVNRQASIEAICEKLAELIQQDGDLVCQVVSRAQERDAQGDEHLQDKINSEEAGTRALTNRINDLEELIGHGSDEDRRRLKARLRTAMSDRASAQLRLARLRKDIGSRRDAITAENVRAILADFTILLENAASGKLEEDSVYRAFSAFRQLVGGRVVVHVERRPGRKQTVVRGVFRPQLLRAVKAVAAVHDSDDDAGVDVEVWLRKPPLRDLLTEPVHQLIDVDDLSFREAAKVLQEQGHNVNSGVAWQIHQRYWEIRGEPVPKRPYNGGRPRKSA